MSRVAYFLSICTFALLLISNQGQAAMITLDFDSLPNGTATPSVFTPIGVKFHGNLEIVDASIIEVGRPGRAAIKGVIPGGDITGEFVGPVQSVSSLSVLAGDSGVDVDTVVLTGYDALVQVVDQSSYTGVSSQILTVTGAGIRFFTITQTNGMAIDDFSFTPENDSPAVPEPSSFVLLGIGLGCAAMVSRRRRRVTNAS